MIGNVLCLVTRDTQVLKCPPHPDGRNSDGNKHFVRWYFAGRLCDPSNDILFYFFPLFLYFLKFFNFGILFVFVFFESLLGSSACITFPRHFQSLSLAHIPQQVVPPTEEEHCITPTEAKQHNMLLLHPKAVLSSALSRRFHGSRVRAHGVLLKFRGIPPLFF